MNDQVMKDGVMKDGVATGAATDDATSAVERAAVDAFVGSVPVAAMVHSMNYVVVGANSLSETVLGCGVEEMVGRPVADFVPLGDRASALRMAAQLEERMSAPPDRGRPVGALRRVRRADGEIVSCWMHVGIADFAGRRFIVALLDLINPVVDDALRWRDRAERDELTGLLRRGPVLAHVDEWVAAGRTVALAFVDVDRLKSINDAHGHPAGDALLEAAGRRLQQWSPPGSVIGRYAGDEFLFAIPTDIGEEMTGVDSGGSVERLDELGIAETVRAVICHEPVPFGSRLLALSVSVGVAIREVGETRDRLIQRADALMYLDKASRST